MKKQQTNKQKQTQKQQQQQGIGTRNIWCLEHWLPSEKLWKTLCSSTLKLQNKPVTGTVCYTKANDKLYRHMHYQYSSVPKDDKPKEQMGSLTTNTVIIANA